jgi:hypothetical protein
MGTDGFTSPSKELMLRILLSLEIQRPRTGLNPRCLGPMVSTITTRSPRPTFFNISSVTTSVRIRTDAKGHVSFTFSTSICWEDKDHIFWLATIKIVNVSAIPHPTPTSREFRPALNSSMSLGPRQYNAMLHSSSCSKINMFATSLNSNECLITIFVCLFVFI